jgi:hypothetical protein
LAAHLWPIHGMDMRESKKLNAIAFVVKHGTITLLLSANHRIP